MIWTQSFLRAAVIWAVAGICAWFGASLEFYMYSIAFALVFAMLAYLIEDT
jgi:hypothetical protein